MPFCLRLLLCNTFTHILHRQPHDTIEEKQNSTENIFLNRKSQQSKQHKILELVK